MDAITNQLIKNPTHVWDTIIAGQPEVIAITGVPQDEMWHPEGSVDIHTRMVIEAAAEIGPQIAHNMGELADLIWAAVCHDLGKATTTQIKNGRVVSPKHQSEGEAPTRSLMTRLGVDEARINRVVALVKEHMVAREGMDEKTVRRVMNRMAGGRMAILAALIAADCSGRPWTGEVIVTPEVREMMETVSRIMVKDAAEAARPKPLITGQDLIDAGMQPGREMGEALKRAAQAQADGRVKTREEAMNVAMKAG